jgi:hypothetical protein
MIHGINGFNPEVAYTIWNHLRYYQHTILSKKIGSAPMYITCSCVADGWSISSGNQSLKETALIC